MTDYQGNPKGFVDEVIAPALEALGLDGDLQAATELLLGTAMQESGLVFRKQLGGGPARGLFQMEPATHDDIWANFLKFRAALAAKVRQFLAGREVDAEELIDNDRYAAAMARIQIIGRPMTTRREAPAPPRSSLPIGKLITARAGSRPVR